MALEGIGEFKISDGRRITVERDHRDKPSRHYRLEGASLWGWGGWLHIYGSKIVIRTGHPFLSSPDPCEDEILDGALDLLGIRKPDGV